MIRQLLVGMAKVTFGLAVVSAVVCGLLVWFSFRMLRKAFRADDAPQEPRAAMFAVLVAVVALLRTLGVRPPAYDPRRSPLLEDTAAHD